MSKTDMGKTGMNKIDITTISRIASAAFLVSLLALCPIFGGCTSQSDDSHKADAAALFDSLHRLTRRYADSIKSAPDSAAAAALFRRYETRLEKIAFSAPPETDLYMTEGQNDTLYMLQGRLVKIYRKKICDKDSTKQVHLASDTVKAKAEPHLAR